MKRIIFTVALIAVLARFSAIAGWQTINGVKTLPLSGASISQLSSNRLDNKFYLFKGDSLIFYNMNGDIDSVKIVNDTLISYEKVIISSDGMTAANFWSGCLDNDPTNITYGGTIQDIDSRKKLFDFNFFNRLWPYVAYLYAGYNFDYNSKDKVGYINGNENVQEYTHGYTKNYSNGATFFIDSTSITYKDNLVLSGISTNWNTNYFLCKSSSSLESYYVESGNQTGYGSSGEERFNMYALKSNKTDAISYYKYNSSGGDSGVHSPKNFTLSSKSNIFLTIDSTICKVWTYDSLSSRVKSSFQVPGAPYWMKFAIDDNYLILVYTDFISIFNTSACEEVERININADFYDLTSDGKKILCAKNSESKLYLLEPKSLSGDTLVPLFTVDKKNIYQGDSIVFTNKTMGISDSVKWDFGDGSYSSEISPTHKYINTGYYRVSLTEYQDTIEKVCIKDSLIQVNDSPFSLIATADTTSGDAPLTVHFTSNQSSNYINARWWNTGKHDGVVLTDTNITVNYTSPGDYTVSLIAFNGIDTITYVYPTKIHVNFTPLRKDSIIEYVDTTSNKSKGYEGYLQPSGDIYILAICNDSNKIFRYGTGFNKVSSISFLGENTSGFHYNFVRDGGNNLYYPENNPLNSNSMVVNKIDIHDNNIKFKPLFAHYMFNIAPAIHGIYVASYSNFYSITESGDSVNYYNNGYYNAYYDLHEWKLMGSSKYNHFLFFSKYVISVIPNRIQYGYFIIDSSTAIQSEETKEYPKNISILNQDTIVLVNNSQIKILRWSTVTYLNISQYFNTINGLQRYSDTSFVAYGSKSNGYAECCWYAIMDVNGNTLNEVFLDNRYGAFNYCSIDDNNRLLFSGYLNFANGSGAAGGKGKVKNEKILTDSVSAGTRLYCLIDKRFSSIDNKQDTITKDTSISVIDSSAFVVKPNPATDKLTISMYFTKETIVDLKLFDVRGSLVGIIADGHYSGAQSFDFDAKSLSSGTYYLRANIGGREYTQKAVVAH